jgi:carbamate kinase
VSDRLAVVAIGGNSLIKRADLRTVEDQYRALCETVEHIAEVARAGWRVVITHGNGPQVGFIMLRSEIAREVAGMHMVPLVSCVADTQGAIGWQIQMAMDNALAAKGLPGRTIALVTQTLVDVADEAFLDPDKPIGEFYSDSQLDDLKRQHPDWILKEDAGRGWRRVVASPKPVDVLELDAVRTLLNAGFHVVAGGGGGIPVVRVPAPDAWMDSPMTHDVKGRGAGVASPPGEDRTILEGVDAVVDKDLASALMAAKLGAALLVISTAVDRVALNYGTPLETPLGRVDLPTIKAYLAEGHFAPGSMAPKIQAAARFLESGGEEVIITRPENLYLALTEGAGTHIVK